ncbi:MAG: alpha/beta hydrolase [Cyanobacteria bacterium P01_E01_bin.42]
MSILNGSWQHEFLTANGVKLHYVTQGKGDLVLLLHGFPEFWYSWRYQIPELAKYYQVVAVDLRGYNESDKPDRLEAYRLKELLGDVRGIIRALGHRQCILVGHDWGGFIAWEFAYEYPEMVEKLVVLNIPHPAKFGENLRGNPQQMLKSWYILAFQLPFLPEFIFQWNDYDAIAKAFESMAIDKTTFSSEDIAAYKDAMAKPGALTAALNYYRNIVPDLLRERKRGILAIPTLMIWGEEDKALGKELTYGTEAYVRDFTIHYIPKCSHWVQQEQPQLVNQYILEFLDHSQS